ncbi:MAG TPA: hypothetical protein VIK33_16340 [Anaerolineae bacterium]
MADNPSANARLQRLRERLKTSAAPASMVHLARAVTGAEDPGLSHVEFQARLPRYVADEAGGLPVGRLYPDVTRHLDLCAGCEAEYLDLLEVALLEEEGALPAPADIPKPDLSFLPRKTALRDYVRALAQDLVLALRPDALDEFRSVVDAFFRWIEQQGGRLIPVRADLGESLGFAEGELPDATLILAATQLATQSLVDALTPQEIQAQIAGGRLLSTAREYAGRSAQKMGLDPQEAHEFAQEYAERIGRNPDALLRSRWAKV